MCKVIIVRLNTILFLSSNERAAKVNNYSLNMHNNEKIIIIRFVFWLF